MRDVAWLMRVASVVSSVVQVKWQFRQENGPLVVLGEAWAQLLLFWRPGSRARNSSEVKRWWAGGPGNVVLGAVQARPWLGLSVASI